jgi:integrase
VQAFINDRYSIGKVSGGWGERRVEMMAQLLRASFNLAMRRRPPLIGWNPLGKHGAVVLPRVPEPKVKPLTHAQAMVLLERIGRQVGIRRAGPKSNVSPHDLRRSAATLPARPGRAAGNDPGHPRAHEHRDDAALH